MEYRGWIRDPSKQSEVYIRGINEFLEFAFQHSEENGKILCPCTKCANCKSHSRTSVYEHLTDPRRGFLRGYRQWIFHGERPTTSSSTTEQHLEMGHDMDDTTREMLKSELNEKWRQWKSDLKSMAYDPSKTEEEVASALPDDRVHRNQYRELVRYWFSEEGQKVSKINRQNRAKFEDLHCMGTKSLPKLIDEKKKKSKGLSPQRKEIYIDTRTRKDGSIVNEKAAKLIVELNKHNNEAVISQSTQNTQSHMPWKDDTYSQVQGPEKRGQQRCMGKIPKPKKQKVSLSENQELRNRVKQVESLLTNVLSLIHNRFSGEDVNDIIQAARQVTDASSAPDHRNSLNPDTNEDTEDGDDVIP